MDILHRTSESVCMGLCRILGTSQQVVMRRDMTDISDTIDIQKAGAIVGCKMKNGSYKEGFRLKGSDVDTMFWLPDNRVIWNMSQTQFYNLHKHTVILSDSSESPPGYMLLWLPMERASDKVLAATVRDHSRLIVSSSKYREIMCPSVHPNSKPHGPCASGVLGDIIEYDHAHCFVSDFWPSSASSWRFRCHLWPHPQIVNDIIRKGCHVVAIGPKLENHEDIEWRISFSLAEQILVRSMNHCQFLVYGLLKLFLKEVLNNGLSEDDKLLCSYHMKMAVFWVLQHNTVLAWGPHNLLQCFWISFKVILKWVYEGVCPNFFIPENNMFLFKIYGAAQQKLFIRLYGLYEKGLVECLLHISSISPYVRSAQLNPRLSICTDEHVLISEAEFDGELFREIIRNNYAQSTSDLRLCMKVLHIVEQLIGSFLTQYQVVMLQKITATVLQSTAFILHNLQTNTRVNKQMYVTDRNFCFMLKLAAKFGFVSDMLHIAMYYYKTFRYKEAIFAIEMTNSRKYPDKERNAKAAGEKSYSTKMTQTVAGIIPLENEICYIDELTPEQRSSSRNGKILLHVPPFVLLHMLEVLCYRHVEPMKVKTALENLQSLVTCDQGVFVPRHVRDISWEILGICQQVTGNLQAALSSYQQSLAQKQFNKIHTATEGRIQTICSSL
ncbi:uncharacterized protein LOC125662893 [Ostrea edulis]|uniref:uncharacterized protein LOC125662893 n=1 Tax=Ostrea edulis TaxID=37623 RepID=UPI0024AF1574|nr:uncharacterized protein LOC125662893 [Ostrea edulis]